MPSLQQLVKSEISVLVGCFTKKSLLWKPHFFFDYYDQKLHLFPIIGIKTKTIGCGTTSRTHTKKAVSLELVTKTKLCGTASACLC